MRIFLLVAFSLFLTFGKAQHIRPIDTKWIEHIKQNKSDTVYVINFWATWCKPCVGELPVFDTLTALYSKQKVKVILVSNDMKKEVEQRLPEFVFQHHMKPEVVWMSELNADQWISAVNPKWGGAIPATWIIQPKKKLNYFNEGEITLKELTTVINKTLRK